MNIIFWVIITALFIEFAIGCLSTVLNMRSLSSTSPIGLEDVYEMEQYRNSQEYTRVNSRFGLLVGVVQLAILLGFWLIGGFNYLDQAVRLLGWDDVWSGVVFIGTLVLFHGLLSLPFSIYATFVIEERFGFNKTTYVTFLADSFKGVLLSAVIGIPVLVGVLSFFQYAGSLAWIYVWIFLTLISFVILILGPSWIMPLFNRFSPLDQGELRNRIVDYADTVNFTYGNIYVIDGSRRSAHSNAFFTGFGKTKRIALFDTLIEQLNSEEIIAVIAHEIGHNKKGHIVSSLGLSILHSGALLFLLSLAMETESLSEAFFMDKSSIYASIVFFGLLLTPIELVLSPIMQFISRRNEYQADQWAVETTSDRQNLVSGLKKLAAKNLANLSPHPVYVALNYSHPPLSRRIESINSLGLMREHLRENSPDR